MKNNEYLISMASKFLLIAIFAMTAQVALQAQNERTDNGAPDNSTPFSHSEDMLQFSFTGTIDGTAPVRTMRLNRNGIGSSCAAPKVCDIFLNNNFFYAQHTFTNPDVTNTVCVDITLDAFCTEGNMDVTVYSGSFNPTSICDNYLADPGLSTGIPQSQLALSVDLAPGETIVLVVSTPVVGQVCTSNGGYEVILSGDFDLTAVAVVPTLGEWGLISLSLVLMIFGIVAVRQRKMAIA